MDSFPLAVKSTIDKMLISLADAKGYGYFDLDGIYQDTKKINTLAPAIAAAFLNFAEDPRDPFWELSFEAGARSTEDISQYVSLGIAGEVAAIFTSGTHFHIYDYSQEVPSEEMVGTCEVIHSMIVPSVFSDSATLRMANIRAKLVRF